MERHDIVAFRAPKGQDLPRLVCAGLLPGYQSDPVYRKVEAFLEAFCLPPGIVCRPTLPMADDQVQLGLSFPFRHEGVRVRSSIIIRRRDVVRVFSPYRVASIPRRMSGTIAEILDQVMACAERCGLECGIIGSAALEIITGQPYTSSSSDIDLVISSASMPKLNRFYDACESLSEVNGVHIDAEVLFEDGTGVKLGEVVSDSCSVLAKSLSDVCILDRCVINHALEKNYA